MQNKININYDDYNVQYFKDLISSFINGTKPEAKQEVNWDVIIYLAQIHSLTGLVGYMVQLDDSKYKPDDTYLKAFLDMYLFCTQHSVNQNYNYQIIISKLCENNIPHILFKGYVVRHYYPLSEVRSMGDIDIVIHEENVKKTDKLLMDLGYKYDKTSGFAREYIGKYACAEMHTNLFSTTYFEKTNNMVRYFSDCWQHAYCTDNGYSYQLNDEYHLIYLICHMVKHFYSGGCGIRMLLDIALYLVHFNDKLNYDYFWQEISVLNITEFTKIIMKLCQDWFGIPLPVGMENAAPEISDSIPRFILERGTFGKLNFNYIARSIRMEYEKKAGTNRLLLRLTIFMKALFPGKEKLAFYYKNAEKSIFGLILAWFIRIHSLTIKRGEHSKKVMSDVKNAGKESELMYDLLRNIGL
jgi:hypothetical protein